MPKKRVSKAHKPRASKLKPGSVNGTAPKDQEELRALYNSEMMPDAINVKARDASRRKSLKLDDPR